MRGVWRAGWRAFRSALPNVFHGKRRHIFLLAVALGLGAGAVLSALVYGALGPRLGDGPPFLAFLICIGGMTVAAAACATVFYLRDRTSQWWIAGTHETTMKRVLAAAHVDALDTVSAQDLRDARRAAEILSQSGPGAIVGPLILAAGATLIVVISAAAGSGFMVLAGLAVFLAEGLTAAAGVITLGRAELVRMATENDRPAAP